MRAMGKRTGAAIVLGGWIALAGTLPAVASAEAADDDAVKSRDDLFGVAPEKSDKSRDDLFGVAPDKRDAEPAVKLSGFYEGLLGYTYAEPAHWSRAVNRFQLSAQGSLGKDVRWKVGGRVDVDPIYDGSNFYLPAVKSDQRFDAFWRENYLDVSAGSWDFRFGAQNIIWGEAVGLFVADVVSARDMRDFILPSFDIIRIPQWALRAEYFRGESHLELIWIPVPTFDIIGKPGADFYPVPLPSPTSQAVASQFNNPDRPDRTLANSNYGVRGNTLVDGWDLAAFYYRSFSTSPTFYRVASGGAAAPVVFQPLYDRTWQAGATVTKDLGEFVLRGEAVYTHGKSFESTDPTATDGVVERATFDYVVSLERPVFNDGRLNVQVFQRIYAGGKSGIALDPGDFGVSLLLSGKIGTSFEPQVLWLQTFGGGGALIRPSVNWYASGSTTVGFGVDVFTGPVDGYFGRYNNRDRIWANMRFAF